MIDKLDFSRWIDANEGVIIMDIEERKRLLFWFGLFSFLLGWLFGAVIAYLTMVV